MRQIQNMQESDSLARDLQKAGILQENIDWMVPYLDMSQPERPELLELARRQDLNTLKLEERDAFFDLLVRLLDHENELLGPRAMKALFRVAGPALARGCRRYSQFWYYIQELPVPLEELVGAEGAAALYAAGYTLGGEIELTHPLDILPETAKGAAELFKTEDPTRAVLACLWLSKQKPKGLLGGLLGKGDTAWAISAVQEYLLSQIPFIYVSAVPYTRTPPQQTAALTDYIRQGGEGPVPVKDSLNYCGMRIAPARVGGMCFLALENFPELKPCFLFCAAIAPADTLLSVHQLAGGSRFRAAVPWLVKNTPFAAVLYPLALTSKGLAKDLARQFPQVFEQAIQDAGLDEAEVLLQIVRSANPQQANHLRMSNQATVQQKALQEILKKTDSSLQRAMTDFLQRGEGLDTLLASCPVGGGQSWNGQMAVSYVRSYGTDPFAVRCLIGVAMTSVDYMVGSIWQEAMKGLLKQQRTAGDLLDLLLEAGLPPVDCLRLAEAAEKGYYNEKEKETLAEQTAQWLDAQPEPVLEQALEKGSAFARSLAARVLIRRRDLQALLPLAGDGSKQVRALVAGGLAGWGLEKGGQAAVTLLQSKKVAQRETGLAVIAQLDQKDNLQGKFVELYRPQLEEALAKEKSAKLAGSLGQLLGVAGGGGTVSPKPAGDPVAEALKGGKKRKVQWVLDGTQQLVSRAGDGALADEDRLAAVMVCCTQSGGVDMAKTLARSLDAKELAVFAQTVYELWMDQGAPSKQKWVLTFAALFGGRDMVDTLKRQISQWPQEARGAIACDAVNALALSPEPEGLLLVDSISRKFKFKQVKAAAGRALEFAAKELGLSPEELADRIVPDLGLDEGGQRVFDFGPRQFTVTLTPALELEVRAQDGKKLKTLPAPGKQDDPALAGEASGQFKALKKQIKATIATQTLRLELALSAARTWTGMAWRDLFVKKPVMRQFAIGLVWGVYENGVLNTTFRYLEDGSLSTADEEEYELADQAVVGLVHPVELSGEELDTWRQQLEDYEIKQPIPQLERPVARVEPGHEGDTALESFGGKVLSGLSLVGKLLGMGWYRGSVEDAGVFYSFYREDGDIGVQMNFSGTWAGGDDSEVEVWDAQFYRVRQGMDRYDAVRAENLVPLGQVPPRLYSEIVYQLQKATAASTETRGGWKSRARNG